MDKLPVHYWTDIQSIYNNNIRILTLVTILYTTQNNSTIEDLLILKGHFPLQTLGGTVTPQATDETWRCNDTVVLFVWNLEYNKLCASTASFRFTLWFTPVPLAFQSAVYLSP